MTNTFTGTQWSASFSYYRKPRQNFGVRSRAWSPESTGTPYAASVTSSVTTMTAWRMRLYAAYWPPSFNHWLTRAIASGTASRGEDSDLPWRPDSGHCLVVTTGRH